MLNLYSIFFAMVLFSLFLMPSYLAESYFWLRMVTLAFCDVTVITKHINETWKISNCLVKKSCYFWWCRYSLGPWVSFFRNDEFTVMSHELISYVSDFCFFLTQWNGNFLKSTSTWYFWITQLSKLNLNNIWSLRSNFIGNESYLKPTYSDILALYETNIEESIYYSNLPARGFLHLIWKNSVSHVHRIAVYVERWISVEREKYLKKTMKILSYERCSMGK